MPLAKYVSGNVSFSLSIYPTKSRNWTSDILNYNYHARLDPLLQLNLLSNKHKWERKGCVCVVLKITGFKSQCKPRAFLCMETLPPGCKAYHLQRDFDRTPPQWGASMATWNRCLILHSPPQTAAPLSQYLITS